MPRPVITAVLTAHDEGLLARPALGSLKRAVARAESEGIAVEVIAVLDRAGDLTRDVVALEAPQGCRILETDYGDPGAARNCAVAEAEGTYVAFLDADDLWGTEWLVKAASLAATRTDPVIWHPEISIYFGEPEYILRHIDMETEEFSPAGLMVSNFWTALSFGPRKIYLENPYPGTDLDAGFGFEDWTWNMTTVERGILHKIVPGTGHVIRQKPQSVSKDAIRARAVPRPNALLLKYLRARSRLKPQGSA